MHYWLFKSEPESFSFKQLQRDKTTEWSGVRNYQARNFMDAMKRGDLGFFYHSSTKEPGIVGTCRVVREAHPDFTAVDRKSEYYEPRAERGENPWRMVEVAFEEAFPRIITLAELRTRKELEGMTLLARGSRLSVQPVTAQQWRAIVKLSRTRAPLA